VAIYLGFNPRQNLVPKVHCFGQKGAATLTGEIEADELFRPGFAALSRPDRLDSGEKRGETMNLHQIL
jgi:hypothetical protein